MALNKGSESRTNNWKTENNISQVWGAASFVQEIVWNNASNVGGVNDRTSRATLGGQVCSLNRQTGQLGTEDGG